VQEFALNLVIVEDAWKNGQDKTRDLRLAIVAGDPEKYLAQMFPESAPDERTQADSLTDADLMATDGATWEMQEIINPADAEEILARMGRTGTITMDDLT